MPVGRDIEASLTMFVQSDEPGADPWDGEKYDISPTEITYKSERYDTAAQLEVSGIVREVDNDFISQFPEANEQDVGLVCEVNNTIIGSGELQNGTVDGDGLWSGTAYDGVRHLRQNTITRTYQGAVIGEIIDDIFSVAGIREVEALFSDINGLPTYSKVYPESIQDLEDIAPGAADPQVEDLQAYIMSKEFTSTPCFEALSEILSEVNWHWWATPSNSLLVSNELPSRGHYIPYVTETSAGKQLPPYQKVRVIGGRRTAEPVPGAQAQHSRYFVGVGDTIRATAGEGEPVYEYEDRSIRNQTNAIKVAEGILQEFRRQQAGGTLSIVGDEEIRPLDGVRLPDHLGGEQYLVAAITHEVSNDNGFTSEIACAGLLDAGEGGELDENIQEDLEDYEPPYPATGVLDEDETE